MVTNRFMCLKIALQFVYILDVPTMASNSYGKLRWSEFSFAATRVAQSPTNSSALGVKNINCAVALPSFRAALKLYLYT